MDASLDEAPRLAHSIIEWLAAERIVDATLADDRDGWGTGYYRPGPSHRLTVAHPDDPFAREFAQSRLGRLQVTTGRTVFYPAQGEPGPAVCPLCGYAIILVDPETGQATDDWQRLVHLTYELLLQGDPETVVNELRSWLDDLLHQILTAPMLWDRLKSKGYARRLLAGDQSTVEALAATVEQHRRRVEARHPALGLVPQPWVTQIVERLRGPDSRHVLLVDGGAGSGKSSVAAEALRTVSAAGWHAAALRIDAVGTDVQSAAALGRAVPSVEAPCLPDQAT